MPITQIRSLGPDTDNAEDSTTGYAESSDEEIVFQNIPRQTSEISSRPAAVQEDVMDAEEEEDEEEESGAIEASGKKLRSGKRVGWQEHN